MGANARLRRPPEAPLPNTHPRADPTWVGRCAEQSPGCATATLTARPEMAVDDRGLVHGGFVFGLADYAAMLAVDDPNVVLGAADLRLLRPVQVGDALVAEAVIESASGKKRVVKVAVRRGETEVLTGTFTAFVLDRHVLDA